RLAYKQAVFLYRSYMLEPDLTFSNTWHLPHRIIKILLRYMIFYIIHKKIKDDFHYFNRNPFTGTTMMFPIIATTLRYEIKRTSRPIFKPIRCKYIRICPRFRVMVCPI